MPLKARCNRPPGMTRLTKSKFQTAFEEDEDQKSKTFLHFLAFSAFLLPQTANNRRPSRGRNSVLALQIVAARAEVSLHLTYACTSTMAAQVASTAVHEF